MRSAYMKAIFIVTVLLHFSESLSKRYRKHRNSLIIGEGKCFCLKCLLNKRWKLRWKLLHNIKFLTIAILLFPIFLRTFVQNFCISYLEIQAVGPFRFNQPCPLFLFTRVSDLSWLAVPFFCICSPPSGTRPYIHSEPQASLAKLAQPAVMDIRPLRGR